MDESELIEALRELFVTRLKFEPKRVAEIGLDTPLPKGLDGSIGLDSLDFIELAVAIEDRFGIAMDESEDHAEHFASVGALCRFIAERTRG
jgi:acyl carrier protein